jgi:GTP cyclohydrolase I
MPVDRAKAEQAIVAFLRAMGLDPDRETELSGTAARVVEAWSTDLIDGYQVDVAGLLTRESSTMPSAPATLVAVRGLAIATMCPHHLLPARGTATVMYLPGQRLTGLGTLARLVDAYAHRLTLQEVIGANVTAALVEHLGARGAACQIALTHECLASRGERQHGATVTTLAFAGTFEPAGPDRDLALTALAEPQ